MRQRKRLLSRYISYLVPLVGGIVLWSGTTEIYYSYRENEQALISLQKEKARAAAIRIQQYIDAIVDDIRWTIVPPLPNEQERLNQQRLAYFTLLKKVPAIAEIVHIDRNGREQIRLSRVEPDVVGSGKDYRASEEFLEATKGNTYIGPIYFRSGTEPFVRLGVAAAGFARHVTLADVNLRFIWDVVSSIDVGPDGTAFVVGAAGNLIAHPDLGLVLARTNVAAVPRVQRAIAELTSGTDHPAWIASDPAHGEAARGALADGERVLSGVALIKSIGWAVFVEQPRSVALRPLWASVLRSGSVLLAGLALSLAASILLTRRLVGPIRMLEAGAERIGKGQLGYRIDVHTGDEVEGLAAQFNRMAQQLQESYATLEQRVEERTRELRDALSEIERKSVELAAANRHKSEFLANMSHELRTPLNAVIGFSEVLGARMFGELNEKQAEYVEDIHGSGQHLLSLINDILDLSKIEAGAMELDIRPFPVAPALESALTLVKERALRRGIVLEARHARDLGDMEADERKLKQMLLNLLSNAVKFTPEGGRVTLEATRADSTVVIAVRDTGVGISSEDQAVIFDEFTQVGTDHARKAEGTGLGLALTRRFVEMHGGQITVESEPGAGSVFRITLPAHPTRAGEKGGSG